jgi:hypothetical protein
LTVTLKDPVVPAAGSGGFSRRPPSRLRLHGRTTVGVIGGTIHCIIVSRVIIIPTVHNTSCVSLCRKYKEGLVLLLELISLKCKESESDTHIMNLNQLLILHPYYG